MRVPYGGGAHGRLVRAHELMHARVSPLSADPFASWPELDSRAVECAEEFRVNQLLARRGFDLAELRDGSETLVGRRLAEAGELAELFNFAAALSGTAALRDLVRGVRSTAPAAAVACRELERALRAAVRTVSTPSLASTEVDASGLPRGFAVHTRELATLVASSAVGRSPGKGGARRGRRVARPSATGRFAPLLLDRSVVLDRSIPGAVAPRRVAAVQGRRVVRPHRLVTDPSRRLFERRARGAGGVVVVDQSGSMALTTVDLERLLAAAPGALVVGYSHAPGSSGVPNAWVLAAAGRAASSVRVGNVGNGVDGPALRFALARRRPGEPVLWICDGQVTDSGDHADLALAAECAGLVVRHGVRMVATVDQAIRSLQRPGRDADRPRLLGRVGACVTATP
jgi:hypothetical protein